jgi:glycosyltransferase EpsD
MHCQSPVGGAVARIAAFLSGFKRRVSYTPHGFHFYKGGPFINRLLFGSAERALAHVTDCIITINKEDCQAAKKLRLRKNGVVEYIPGVGIKTKVNVLCDEDCRNKRVTLGIPETAFLIVSVGELNKNKNHELIIRAIGLLPDNIKKDIQYIICGEGLLKDYLLSMVKKLGLNEKVRFLGHRNDVLEILQSADMFAIASKREGLPKSLMEAMSVGLPVVATRIRGNTDLIEDEKNGILVEPDDIESTGKAIEKLYGDIGLREKFSQNTLQKIKEFDLSIVQKKMWEIFNGK